MHIAFDFDYTLADSSEGTVACANYALRQMGLKHGQSAKIKKTIGLSLERTYESLTQDANEHAAASFKAHFLTHAQAVMLSHIHFYDHTPLVLRQLNEQGHYLSIVSTKLRERIDEALQRDGLSALVQQVVGGGCVAKNKPDPEGLLNAMAVSGISRKDTLYVGDSVSDGECAQRAGVAFAGVLSGTTPKNQLAAWHPKLLLEHVGQLPHETQC